MFAVEVHEYELVCRLTLIVQATYKDFCGDVAAAQWSVVHSNSFTDATERLQQARQKLILTISEVHRPWL